MIVLGSCLAVHSQAHALAGVPACGTARVTLRPGDAADIYHRVPYEVDTSRRVSSRLRPFVYEDGIYLGSSPPRHSYEPNCLLAPSTDGGQTRVLVATQRIDEGEQLLQPMALVMENLFTSVDTISKEELGMDLVRHVDDEKGRGVFAHRDYHEGELVATWPALLVPQSDDLSCFGDYLYASPVPGTNLLGFGHAMLYNHADEPNLLKLEPSLGLDAMRAGGHCELSFYARRAVRAGEELCHRYGSLWWSTRPHMDKAGLQLA